MQEYRHQLPIGESIQDFIASLMRKFQPEEITELPLQHPDRFGYFESPYADATVPGVKPSPGEPPIFHIFPMKDYVDDPDPEELRTRESHRHEGRDLFDVPGSWLDNRYEEAARSFDPIAAYRDLKGRTTNPRGKTLHDLDIEETIKSYLGS
jgi:hypothetical protein